MEFFNETDYQADALWGAASETTMGVVALVKRTFVVNKGEMTPTMDNPWPVHFQELETPYGTFPSEYHPYPKPRTDFIICGSARSKEPVSSMTIEARAGDFHHSFRVFGDRYWKKSGKTLHPSEPESFTKIPLTLENAYGGKVNQEWGELAYVHNPIGKGYYLTEAQAEGGPLPNIESDDGLIKSYSDQPIPFAPTIYPMNGGLRLAPMGDTTKPDGPDPQSLQHLFLCWAHPEMMLESPLRIGDEISVNGILESGLLTATMPPLDAHGYIDFGTKSLPLSFICDTIIVHGEEKRITFRWRASQTFPLTQREKRVIYLKPEPSTERSSS